MSLLSTPCIIDVHGRQGAWYIHCNRVLSTGPGRGAPVSSGMGEPSVLRPE